MTSTTWLILGIVAFDLVFALVVVRLLAHSALEPIVREFPAVEPVGVVHDRRAQSFRIGLMNLGFSLRVRTDAGYIHLTPEPWVRWTGLHAVSLPVDCLRAGAGRPRKGWLHPIEIEGERVQETIHAPRWVWLLAGGAPMTRETADWDPLGADQPGNDQAG